MTASELERWVRRESAKDESFYGRRGQTYFVVYGLMDANGRPQYVGVSSNPWARERTHRRDARFAGLVFEVLDSFRGTGAAYAAEREYITALRPKFNFPAPEPITA